MAISHNQWLLKQRLVDLSVADNFKQALGEWTITGVEVSESGEPAQTCLCSHYPIREIFHIHNPSTHQTALIGNVCIQLFAKEDDAGSTCFQSAHKIIESIKKIRSDRSSSAGRELIAFAYRAKIISSWENGFYNDVWLKRRLSSAQKAIKTRINRKMLFGVRQIAYRIDEVFWKINADRTASANPQTIETARSKGLFQEHESRFYLDIWAKSWDSLTLAQQRWKLALNHKITSTPEVFDRTLTEEGESALTGAQRQRVV
ncbi:MAG: hypothetical protein WC371_05165 [Parachlamydiales bacterium]|jgi:hypothetical protein